MKKIPRIFLTAVLAAQFGLPSSGFPADVEVPPTITYKIIQGHHFKLYAFYPWRKAGTVSPAIVLFHGGGWTHGDPEDVFPQCEYLASRGMVAFSVEYRTRNNWGTRPFACDRDGKSAIRWVRAHAATLGVDPNRIAAGGGSAGAQMAAAAGTIDGLDEVRENLSVSSRPDALVLFNPVIDNGPGGYGYARLGDRYKEISPIDNISKNHPPTIILTGDRDKFVAVKMVKKYKKLLNDVGVRCDLHIYPGQPHAFYRYRPGQLNKNFVTTMRDVDKFLVSLGYLSGTPNPALSSFIYFGSDSVNPEGRPLRQNHS